MKAVILIGGTGSRLRPITHVVNKNLLPIYNKPAIFYSIELVKDSGIKDICIVGEYTQLEPFKYLLGNGTDFNVNITYESDSPLVKGPASALLAAKKFVDGDNVLVMFSDNLFDTNVKHYVKNFDKGALLFTKSVKNPSEFGVVTKNSKGEVIDIVEKPTKPKSNLVLTGLQIYDNKVFKYLQKQKPGFNGEYMLADINNKYVKLGQANAVELKGFWQDMGTFDGLYRASTYFYKKSKEQGNKAKVKSSNKAKTA